MPLKDLAWTSTRFSLQRAPLLCLVVVTSPRNLKYKKTFGQEFVPADREPVRRLKANN